MALCIAVIDKNNYPLYVSSNDLQLHNQVHVSLDIIEEKISNFSKMIGKAGGDTRELYLGSLYSTEEYKIFGYVTNTKIKFIIVVESVNTSLRDSEIKMMFRKLHNSYTDVVCNPFYIPGDPLNSKSFSSVVNGIMNGVV